MKDVIKETLTKYNVKSVLTQNSKMKKSGNTDLEVYNWGIPAFRAKDGFKTCPNAGLCAAGCYARSGAYLFSNVAQAFENRLALSKDKNFDFVMIDAISKALKKAEKKNKSVLIRIHDSGDFYNLDYTLTWFRIMKAFEKNTDKVQFYAYTKQVEMFKGPSINENLPNNFTLIYSYGGKQDDLINPLLDRHSMVFESTSQLNSQGYIDASENDLLALTDNNRIGLVFHHAKSFKNTKWSEVKVK